MGKTSTAGILSGVGTNDFGGIISAEAYHQKLGPNFSLMDQDFASVCQIEGSFIHHICMSGEKLELGQDEDHGLRSYKRYISVSVNIIIKLKLNSNGVKQEEFS